MRKILIFATYLLLLISCKKGEVRPVNHYAGFVIDSKVYIDNPVVDAYVNGTLLGRLEQGGVLRKLIARNDDPITLAFKDTLTGEVYLDSVFTPGNGNNLTILIDNSLGIRQFYKPSTVVPTPISPDSFRVQFFHKIEYKGIRRNITFKVFEDISSSSYSVTLNELPIKITVPYGEISANLDVPYEMRPDGSGRIKKYRLKAYDAVTDELIVDISPSPVNNAFPGTLNACIIPGGHRLVRLGTVEEPGLPTGLLWQYNSSDSFEPLQ